LERRAATKEGKTVHKGGRGPGKGAPRAKKTFVGGEREVRNSKQRQTKGGTTGAERRPAQAKHAKILRGGLSSEAEPEKKKSLIRK